MYGGVVEVGICLGQLVNQPVPATAIGRASEEAEGNILAKGYLREPGRGVFYLWPFPPFRGHVPGWKDKWVSYPWLGESCP